MKRMLALFGAVVLVSGCSSLGSAGGAQGSPSSAASPEGSASSVAASNPVEQGVWSGTLHWKTVSSFGDSTDELTLTATFRVVGRPRFVEGAVDGGGRYIDTAPDNATQVQASTTLTNLTGRAKVNLPSGYVRLGVVLPMDSPLCRDADYMQVRSGIQQTASHCFFPIMELTTNSAGYAYRDQTITTDKSPWIVPWRSIPEVNADELPEVLDELNNPTKVAVLDCWNSMLFKNQGFGFPDKFCTMVPVDQTPFTYQDVGGKKL